MGEHLTADMLIAVEEINKLVNETEKEEVRSAAKYVIAKLHEELNKRPTHNTREVDEIITQIHDNFGDRGYLTRTIICVMLMKQAYGEIVQDPNFIKYFNIIEEEIKTKRNLIPEGGVSRK